MVRARGGDHGSKTPPSWKVSSESSSEVVGRFGRWDSDFGRVW